MIPRRQSVLSALLGAVLVAAAFPSGAAGHDDELSDKERAAAASFRSLRGKLGSPADAWNLDELDRMLRPLADAASPLTAHALGHLIAEPEPDGQTSELGTGAWPFEQTVDAVLLERRHGRACPNSLGVWFLLSSPRVRDRALAIGALRRRVAAGSLAEVVAFLAKSESPDVRFHAGRLAAQLYCEGHDGPLMTSVLWNLVIDRDPAVAAAILRGPFSQVREPATLDMALRRTKDDREIGRTDGVPDTELRRVGDAALLTAREFVMLSHDPQKPATTCSVDEIAAWRATEAGSRALATESDPNLVIVDVDLELERGVARRFESKGRTFDVRLVSFRETWNGLEFRQSMALEVGEVLGDVVKPMFDLKSADQSEDWFPRVRAEWSMSARPGASGEVVAYSVPVRIALRVSARCRPNPSTAVPLHLRILQFP